MQCSSIATPSVNARQQRQRKIIALVEEAEELSLHDLAQRLGRVSVVTLRRDVADLTQRGLLERTRGGAALPRAEKPGKRATEAPGSGALGVGEVDAIILPPVGGAGTATLRSLARRRQIPFIAETVEQEGGLYVGHDNFAVGRRLGRLAGSHLNETMPSAELLIMSSEMLANTRSRSDGFLKGFTETFKGRFRHWRVDGQGIYREAKRVAREALSARPSINVVFGVNDHSVLALLDAARETGAEVHGFSVGGEGENLFNTMMEDPRLAASAALFPEIVGMKAIDTIAGLFDGQTPKGPVRAPHAIITRANLTEYYRADESGWTLRAEMRRELAPELSEAVARSASRRAIGFVPHFPAHDWYRNMIRAMEARCAQYGYELRVAPPQAGIAQEIAYLRGLIARAAAARVKDGDTVVINAGEISRLMVDHLDHLGPDSGVTVVTNSLDILERLSARGRVKVILTSGEYQARDRCLVGPSLGALFETMRVDKAFLSVDGFSPRFGPSCADERLAQVARRFCSASREVHVMADHALFGASASHRIVPLAEIHEVISDRGTLSSDRLELMAAGIRVTLADAEPPPGPQ